MRYILICTITMSFFGLVAFAQSEYPITYETEAEGVDPYGVENEEIPEDLSTAVDASTFKGEDVPASYSYEEEYGGFDIDEYESENPFDYEDTLSIGSDGVVGSEYDSTDMMGVDEYTYGENWDKTIEEREQQYYGRGEGGHNYGMDH